jgi:hypothetical protein
VAGPQVSASRTAAVASTRPKPNWRNAAS